MTALAGVPASIPGPGYGSLRAAFDNVGTSDDRNPSAGDLDGAGHSFSAQDLERAGWRPGAAITVAGTRFTWPDVAPGHPDNVVAAGQTIALGGTGAALSFLCTGARGASTGVVTVSYVDGAAMSYRLAFPDWHAGPANRQAVGLPHQNTATGQQPFVTRLYALSVPLVRAKTLRSVTLPRSTGTAATVHVFAVAIRPDAGPWVGSWAAAASGLRSAGRWTEQTLRMVVHTSIGGPSARIRLENTFAARPVTIGRATVARQLSGAVPDGPPRTLAFGGQTEVTIPAGGQALSDPLDLAVPDRGNLLVSLYLPGPVTGAPFHHQARQTNYTTRAGAGDHAADTDASSFTIRFGFWTLLSGVDVVPSANAGSVVALGDSITDGAGSTVGANRRWPDQLAARLSAQWGVLDAGISGNKVVSDQYPGGGASRNTGGTSAMSRLHRDVLAQTGVRTVIVLEGINDLKAGAPPAQVIAGLRWIAAEAHAYGLRVLAGTITPFEGWRTYTRQYEANRRAVNAFIRNGAGVFDGYVDFDRAVRDPNRPQRLRARYDCGDHLHPSDAGYRAMAQAIDLAAL